MTQPTQLRMQRYRVLKTDNPKYVVGEVLLFRAYRGARTKMTCEHKGRTDVVSLKWIGVTGSTDTATEEESS